MKKSDFKNRVSDATNIPKDIILGVPLMRLIGQEEFYLENYRGILEYTDTLIRIQTKTGLILIHGNRLEVVYYTNDEMKVVGRIDTLEFKS